MATHTSKVHEVTLIKDVFKKGIWYNRYKVTFCLFSTTYFELLLDLEYGRETPESGFYYRYSKSKDGKFIYNVEIDLNYVEIKSGSYITASLVDIINNTTSRINNGTRNILNRA